MVNTEGMCLQNTLATPRTLFPPRISAGMISEYLTALINTVRRSFSFPKPTGSAECVSTCTEEGRHIKWWIMPSAINGTSALNETLSKMDEGRCGNISTKDRYLLASHSCSSGWIWICFLSINECLVRAIVKSECLGKEELNRRQESYCWKTAGPPSLMPIRSKWRLFHCRKIRYPVSSKSRLWMDIPLPFQYVWAGVGLTAHLVMEGLALALWASSWFGSSFTFPALASFTIWH